jgi:hypothetical protein
MPKHEPSPLLVDREVYMNKRISERTPILSNGVYDFFKYLAQIVLPAAGTFYFALAQIWGLPAAEEVVGTIVALDAFIGVVLGLSNARYKAIEGPYDGVMEIEHNDHGQKVFNLELNGQPDELIGMREIRFKVNAKNVTGHWDETASTPGDLPPVPPVR